MDYKTNPHQFYKELRPAIHGLAYIKKTNTIHGGGVEYGYEYDPDRGLIVDAVCDLIEHLLQVAESGRATPLEKL